MSSKPPSLSAKLETVLFCLAEDRLRGGPAAPLWRLANRCKMNEAACWALVQELKGRGLVLADDPGPGRSLHREVALTEAGNEAVAALGVLPPQGPVPEFAVGLDNVQRAVLDAIVEHELRVPNGSAKRSQVRTRVRQLVPGLDISDVNDAIERCGSDLLKIATGAEPYYEVTLRGLLASSWGDNALTAIEQTLSLLRRQQAENPSLFRFAWGALRMDADLPEKALNLFYEAVQGAKLGTGLFDTEGDRWWSTPPDLDEILEHAHAIDYVRTLLRPAVPPPTAPILAPTPNGTDAVPRTATDSAMADKDERAERLLARLEGVLAAHENPTIRLHDAFDRLQLHPVIQSASAELFRDGHAAPAVLYAGVALVNYVKEKSGRTDLDGTKLMQAVFSVENPILAFTDRRDQSDKDEQQGLMHLFVGAVLGLRNPRAHSLDEDSPEFALEAIGFLSFLAKHLDRATKVTKEAGGGTA